MKRLIEFAARPLDLKDARALEQMLELGKLEILELQKMLGVHDEPFFLARTSGAGVGGSRLPRKLPDQAA